MRNETNRVIELRPIKILIERGLETYIGTCRECRIVDENGFSRWWVERSEIPCAIDGFFKRSPERLGAAIKDALLKNMAPKVGQLIRIRRIV